MVPVSQLLRGRLYSTHLTVRCPNYHRCIVCGSCRHYDHNNLACHSCEHEHKQKVRCRCRAETLLAVRLLTHKIGREMLHPDNPAAQRLGDITEPEIAFAADRLNVSDT